MGFGDFLGDVVDTAKDVVTDPVGTVVAPIANTAGDVVPDFVDIPDFTEVLDTVTDTLGDAGGAIRDVASETHHFLLDEVPYYRAADGFVHDVKHEASEIDWSDPNSDIGATASIAASGGLRFLQGTVDTVEEQFGTNETLRLNDFDSGTQDYVRDIFQDSVEFEDVRIVVGGATTDLPFGAELAPHVVGNTVYVPESYVETSTTGELSIKDEKLGTFGHELAHVWQNQNGGGDYAAEAIVAQGEAFITTGDRNNAYRGLEALAEGTPFSDLNPEEQADVIGEIGEVLADGGTLSPELAEVHRQVLAGDNAP